MTDFGIHLVSASVVDLYKDGAVVRRCGHQPQTGPYACIAVAGTGPSPEPEPHIDRFELRSGGPSGSVVYADDFVGGLGAGWSLGWNDDVGSSWIEDPAGFLYTDTSGSAQYRSQPGGVDWIAVTGVTFDGSVTDGWVQIALSRTDPNLRFDLGGADQLDGYRAILRAPGAPNAGNAQLLNCLSAGFVIGRVPIGVGVGIS